MEEVYQAIFGEAPKTHLDAFSFGIGFAFRALIALALQRIAEYEFHKLVKKGVKINFMPSNITDLINLVSRKGWRTSELIYPAFMIFLAFLNSIMEQLNGLSVDPTLTLAAIGSAVVYGITRFALKMGASFALGKALSPDTAPTQTQNVVVPQVVQESPVEVAPAVTPAQQVASDQFDVPPFPAFAPVEQVVQ